MSRPNDNTQRESRAPVLDPAAIDPSEEALQPVSGARIPRTDGLTPDGRLKSGRLAGLSMRRAIWVLYWPIVLESILTSLVGMTDTYLAAQISLGATDAIGGAAYLLWFIGLVIMAVSVGATALISRSIGAGRFAVANTVVGQTMLLALVSGGFVGGIVALCAVPAAQMMGLKPEGATAFVQYMRILALGVPFTAVLSSLTACARGAGDSLRPLYAMGIVNVVNMVVSWILAGVDLSQTTLVNGEVVSRTLLHNPFNFNMGVRGIAWGTFIAEAVGMLIVLGILIRGIGAPARPGAPHRPNHVVRLRAKRLRPHWHTMRRLVRVGLPSFFETFGMWIGNFAVILLVGAMGSEALLGSHIIAVRVEAFSFGPGFAMGMVASILAGQYLGAGSPAMARRALIMCTIVASAQMGVMGLIFMGFGRPLAGIISSQPDHLHIVPGLLFITGIVQITFAIGIALRVGMRGAGDAKWVMYLTWVTTYGVRLPLVYLLSRVDIHLPPILGGGTIPNPSPYGGTLWWVWVALCTEVVIRAVVFLARFLHGGWLKHRV